MFSFEGKKALVTGGGRGIGRAIALAFASQGADIALAARSRYELDNVAAEIRALGRKAFVHALDLANTEQAANMVDTAAGELGSLDVLVNNAGGITDIPGSIGPLAEATIDAFDAMYALNVRTPLFAAVAACRVISRQGKGGAILNIVSIDALFPAPTEGIYAIAPGVIETRLTEPWLRTQDQRADRASFYPLNRVGMPDDIAGAAVYLCSDEAGWVSGNVLYVTGGQLATSDVFRWVRAHNPVPDSSKI